ncbi:MAG TPA: ATP-binding protein [Usitatibacter sp.]|jgi:two-component system sensor histidine kinase BaeS|nr:ATP-binding protein [Usitatibacter sp.]
MTLGVTPKLFLAVLFTNVITAVAVGLGVRAAFVTGFESYVQQREDQRLTRLAGVLANAYKERGSWEFLRGNRTLWSQFNQVVRPDALRRRDTTLAGSPRLPAGNALTGDAQPPPAVVLDLFNNVIVGDADLTQEVKTLPISIDGRQVGWLTAPLRHPEFDLADSRFQDEQKQAGWTVLLLAIGLSAVVAGVLSHGLLAPLMRIAEATRRLAEGEYGTRVAATSHDEIGQLVQDFNRLGNTLEKNEKLRRDYMADASHELRTPIAILKAEIEALQDGLRHSTPETLRSLHAEVGRLEKLVHDLHDLSLADVGVAYHFTNVDLAQLVHEALEGARDRIAAAGLKLEERISANPVRVRADAQRLLQLVGNLAENSARYTESGGRVRVSVSRIGREAHLDWEDSTPGVPDEALEKIFERLFRVEGSRSRDGGGSGLGLAIVRSIAQAHGGRIAAAHSGLGGLRIELRLPIVEGA